MKHEPVIKPLDDATTGIFVELDREFVVLFQGLFDLTEHTAIARTVAKEYGTIAIIASHDMVPRCLEILADAQPLLHWRTPRVVPDQLFDLTAFE